MIDDDNDKDINKNNVNNNLNVRNSSLTDKFILSNGLKLK